MGRKGNRFLQKGARRALFPSYSFLLPHSTPTELHCTKLGGEEFTGKKDGHALRGGNNVLFQKGVCIVVALFYILHSLGP